MNAQAERYDDDGHGIGMLMLGLLLLGAAAGIFWVYIGMTTQDRWPIRWLDVTGGFERVSAEQVRTRVAPMIEGSYFTVDMARAEASVEALPWVADALVRKRWPDGVEVQVTEFVPVAHWTGGQLLATDGRPFSVPGADGIQGLPWLEGPEGSLEEVIAAWQGMNERLQAVGLEATRVSLDPRGAWRLELNNGTHVALGRDDPMPRLDRLVDGWDALARAGQGTPRDIDLRYANGFAVRWPDIETGATQALAHNR
ncbi:FtsQ-type POTRA domain-containing protein [Marinihelvus fidelis]|uniref:Cell division protein FtsQ n=1 Tax=Marinihelvus fidelis TaxID=2613842 RepID=A0A5N0T7C8_9GAMM|nr:cell division protein FtsQ/DivIB [Marinihelvus fidelis]KAA9129726.1 FtsQ-type POTRA domain-containing protein [Marinihelvus fidelis]